LQGAEWYDCAVSKSIRWLLLLCSVCGVGAASPIPACQTAATLQDLINFGSSGCLLPGGLDISSWAFNSYFLVSGNVVPASSIAVSIDPPGPDETPNLFHVGFTVSIPVPVGDTLELSLAYSLGVASVITPSFYFVGLPAPPPFTEGDLVGIGVTASSALCVGGNFTGDVCSGVLYQRLFSDPGDPLGAASVGPANQLEFTDFSSYQYALTVPGSDGGGIAYFQVDSATQPQPQSVPEPSALALLALGLGGMLVKRALISAR
jgi:hypothetical protein